MQQRPAGFPHHYLTGAKSTPLGTPYIGSANTPVLGGPTPYTSSLSRPTVVQNSVGPGWFGNTGGAANDENHKKAVAEYLNSIQTNQTKQQPNVESELKRTKVTIEDDEADDQEEDGEGDGDEDNDENEEEEFEPPKKLKNKTPVHRTKTAKAKKRGGQNNDENSENSEDSDEDGRGRETPRQRMHRELNDKLEQLLIQGYKYSPDFDPQTATRLAKRHEIIKGNHELKANAWVRTSQQMISTVANLASLATTQLKGEVNKYEPNVDERKLRQVFQGGLGPLEAFTDPKWAVCMEFIQPWVMSQTQDAIQTVASVTMQRMMNQQKREERMASRPSGFGIYSVPHGERAQWEPLTNRSFNMKPNATIQSPFGYTFGYGSHETTPQTTPSISSSPIPLQASTTTSTRVAHPTSIPEPSPAHSEVSMTHPSPAISLASSTSSSSRRSGLRRHRNALLMPAMMPPEVIRPPDGFRTFRPSRPPIVFGVPRSRD